MMTRASRRTFIKHTGGFVVASAAISTAEARASSPLSTEPLPPHRRLAVPGLHAYPLRHSVEAGDWLELCVSSTSRYDLAICRLGVEVDDPLGDEVVAQWSDQPPQLQFIHPGSYLHVGHRIETPLHSLSLECWVRCFAVDRRQALLGQVDRQRRLGVGVAVGRGGSLEFSLRTDSGQTWTDATEPGVLQRDVWRHVVAAWDGQIKRVDVDGRPVGQWACPGAMRLSRGPFQIGAAQVGGVADDFLDGDVAMPAVYTKALSVAESAARCADRGLSLPTESEVLACWPLDEEQGAAVRDAAGAGWHGRLVNSGTWMIGGPAFQADVARFGEYDPNTDATRGHGVRFASDDLYDCRWPIVHRWRIPPDSRSGIYVARFRFVDQGESRTYHVTFLVRRNPRRPRAPLLAIAATTTWRAYGGTPFAKTPREQFQVWDIGGLDDNASKLPAYCLYRQHAAGQGTYQVGLRMPWPAAGPYVLYSGATRYSHLMRADRFTLAWLEQQGYEYDLVANEDLHRDPGLIDQYQACAILGHNEYWSLPMYRAIEDYLKGGGRLVVLSGNTMGWRVSFDEDLTVMECRKVDAGGNQVPPGRRGEAWHSHDGLRGGAQRECGMAGYRLIGLDILGWNYPSNPKNYGPYVVEDEGHFLFREPEDSGLRNGDKFGWATGGQFPMANGHEVDVRPSTFAALQELPSPQGGMAPVDPEGIVRIANGIIPWSEGGSASDYFFRDIEPQSDQGGEMIYWQRPDGGTVFNAGSIAVGWLLHHDQKLAGVVRNLLSKFGVVRSQV